MYLFIYLLRKRERERERDMFIIWNRLAQLWRLRSPTICSLQVEDPEKLVVQFTLSLKAFELRELMV